MDSLRMDSIVRFAELEPGQEELFANSEAATRHTDANSRDATRRKIVYEDADECLSFESDRARSGSIRCVETSANNRQVLWARDEPIAMAIVDGDADSRLFLLHILEKSGGYRCVGCYAAGEEALREIPSAQPRIVLMDVRLPGIPGLECMRRLKGRLPGLSVVLVSAQTDPDTMAAALAAGGDGYLTKPFAAAQCLATVRFAFRPGRSAPRDSGEAKETSTRRGDESTRLTDREHHVMSCLERGLLYKEIADELRLSFSVVHKLQHRIFLKLQVSNRTEAVSKWRHGNGG